MIYHTWDEHVNHNIMMWFVQSKQIIYLIECSDCIFLFFSYLEYEYKLMLKILMTERPGFIWMGFNIYRKWLCIAHTAFSIINVREYWRGNQNGQSRETGNIGYTRWRETKQKHNTICVGHHYTQINTNNVNKTWALIQTTGGKDEPNIVYWYTVN